MIFGQFELLINILGAVLLVAVIFYVVRLNRNLSALKANKAELDALIAAFNESTSRAEASVARLKVSATETATSLQAGVDKAQELRDDLAFMTGRADELATRLESGISGARNVSQSAAGRKPSASEAPRTAKPEEPAPDPESDERGKSKAELLRALQGIR